MRGAARLDLVLPVGPYNFAEKRFGGVEAPVYRDQAAGAFFLYKP